MGKKKFLLLGFGFMVLLQLALPGQMIFQWEQVLEKGTPYKFRVEPVDPRDPFRGNYLTLRYEADSISVEAPSAWNRGQRVHLSFDTTSEGFVTLMDVSKEPFEEGTPSFQAEIEFVHHNTEQKDGWLELDLPFDRYFIDREGAKEAEDLYFEAVRDSSSTVWGRVKIHDGRAAIEDVMVDGRSVEDLLGKDAPAP